MKKMKFNWTWLGILLAVCLMVGVPVFDVLADAENLSAEESSAEEFCMHQIPSDDCASCSLQALDETLTLSVEYPSVIKCGEPTTFTLNVTGGSGNYKYRLAHIMIKDGSELLQVYDVSYPTKPNLGDYSENNQIEFTFYASGTYYIGFSAMDMDTYNTVSTRLYDYTLDIQDESYPSVESIVETVAAECETKCTTDFEKALWMHDWMLDNADYDYSYKYCSAEGILARGMGTCEAYHRTYVKLLNKVGIQTGRITGNGHVWTAVKMDGEWYQVDSTWDDGGEANKGTFYEHMYFGLNDSITGLVHSDHSSAVPGYESTSLENNYFIKTGQITQWSDPFVDEIKKNIADGKTEFELSVTNSMPAAYKNVIYNLVAYQLSRQVWDDQKISVSYEDNTLYCKLYVSATSVTLSKSSANLIIGSILNLTATVRPSNSSDTVTWNSSDTSVATVSSSGQVKAVGAGKATITATAGTASATCSVTVVSAAAAKAKTLEFTEVTPALYMGGNTGKFTVAVTSPENCIDTIKWSTSNKRVVEIIDVSADGKTITIQSGQKGTATITAKSGSGKSVSYKVTSVNQAAESVTLNKYSADIYVGKTVSLWASKILPRGCNDVVIWESSDESIATVTPGGVVKGISQGKVTIRANSFGGVQNEVKVTVRTRAQTLEFTEVTPALYMGGNTGKFTVKIASPEGSNDTIKWSTGNKRVVKIFDVSADGKTITIKSGLKGTATITARAGSGKSVSYKVTSVNQAAESVTLNKYSADIYVGKTVSLRTSKVLPRGCNDVVIWESLDESIATVTPGGVVKGISQGTVTIRANSFGGVQNEVKVTVRTKAQNVWINTAWTSMYEGETINMSAEPEPFGCNDTITWTTSNKSVASLQVSSDGKSVVVTGNKKGTATITAKTGSGKYKRVKIYVV
ncbi:MAG: Ig-like domain-containing protein [Firmicutes bacterium]|nr:Ig-like domain-containing protein [Bacillota bacterium]